MNEPFEVASDGEIEVRVNLADRRAPVVWRRADSEEDRWFSTAFQSADVGNVQDALKEVVLWLSTNDPE